MGGGRGSSRCSRSSTRPPCLCLSTAATSASVCLHVLVVCSCCPADPCLVVPSGFPLPTSRFRILPRSGNVRQTASAHYSRKWPSGQVRGNAGGGGRGFGESPETHSVFGLGSWRDARPFPPEVNRYGRICCVVGGLRYGHTASPPTPCSCNHLGS